MYAVIKLVVAATQHYFGDSALYAAAGISGLTDLDAITLSTAKLVEDKRLPSNLGWQLILLAAMSNLAFKEAIAVVVGHWRLAVRTLVVFLQPRSSVAG
jgi:uncharacterized membrane protein (DUF4010 family)